MFCFRCWMFCIFKLNSFLYISKFSTHTFSYINILIYHHINIYFKSIGILRYTYQFKNNQPLHNLFKPLCSYVPSFPIQIPHNICCPVDQPRLVSRSTTMITHFKKYGPNDSSIRAIRHQTGLNFC